MANRRWRDASHRRPADWTAGGHAVALRFGRRTHVPRCEHGQYRCTCARSGCTCMARGATTAGSAGRERRLSDTDRRLARMTTLLGSSLVLWYVTRGTGAVALTLLTASLVLGVVSTLGWRSTRWPRFALNAM